MDDFNWDDLRFVLAVARHGSVAAAARILKVTHGTVLRRLQKTELTLGTRIFDRLAAGYKGAEGGKLLIAAAETIEATVNETRRRLSGQRAEVDGKIRFTTTDALMECMVSPILASFRAKYPAITVEVMISNSQLDLQKHAADIALRPSVAPPDKLVGKRLGPLVFGLYATPGYLAQADVASVAGLYWLLPDGALENSSVSSWLQRALPNQPAALRANSFIVLRQLAEAGLGVAPLPVMLVRPGSPLRCVSMVPKSGNSELWLLTHADLRYATRIKLFIEHMAEHVRQQRDLYGNGGQYAIWPETMLQAPSSTA
ncbi:LysR family transcriptional regulator [Janthinobacterium agaricidamnosum]|uniref:Bacterial regulatory helix-turn-helix, lysR family protein n=1 Tax=Janthinobacterium agaricidamnosum NBRC 102515 = DSM 9628 TaxID=1349767 RepID=W0V531_9BURK|nr:LysR family transcriptional regulator [Janthinobacterium agaricidamnosum]CDG82387.1 bacterial regulatory helix-turn-helix, lysR family protein [Janthinobacterium agaricidamnosum NBRC 102515 = DSM 9628]